ncbi:hypothetical protein [uncultured Aquimonas sp.]|uniref:hypothetical protein n=1 Tax=uncultured Aquimonas sp. TaxID=385483 RepID=UPI00260A8211|nr:hypothetical protein [uncultured Aquimonas sp.]
MLATAIAHFNADIDRAKSLRLHAITLPAGVLQSDILRAAWMMAVGACDAYFSDAYADFVSRAIRAKELQPAVSIPDRLNNLKLPVTALLRPANGGWRWRMAARELIESENVLSLEKIRSLFNHFCRPTHKLINKSTLGHWITHPTAKKRMFGVSSAEYSAATSSQQNKLREDAMEHFEGHYGEIFQRRHDCIHNCDRPKQALQPIGGSEVLKRIEDVEYLVRLCHSELLVEFPEYLKGLGFSGAIRAQVCQ